MTTQAKQPARKAGKASKPKREAKAKGQNGTQAEERKNDETTTAPAKPWLFQPGNPGRPKGSRNKLGEQFVADLYADWQKHGFEVLEKVRENRPDAYMKVIASILPKQVEVSERPLDEFSDDDLSLAIAAIAAARSAGSAGKRTSH